MPDTTNLKTKKETWAGSPKASPPWGGRQEKESLKKGGQNESEKAPNPPEKNKDNLIEWSAPEFIKHEKDFSWFAAAGIIAAIIFTISLFAKNYIFGIVIILSVFSLYIWAQKEPKKYKFKINPKGIAIGKNIYGYDNLKSFWIFYDPPRIKYLSIESKKILMPKIVIPIGEEDPNKIRGLLIKFLPEKEQEESLTDVLGRHLRY
jgi:hypothetical protein